MGLQKLQFSFFVFLFFVSFSKGKFYDPPEVEVDKWVGIEDEDFEDWNIDFTDIPAGALKYLDRGSTIVVSQHIGGLGIVCNASYPVEWVFEHAEHIESESFNVILKTARESTDVNDPRGDRFLAILELFRLFGDSPTNTGKYVCKSLGHETLEKGVYVFWDVDSPPYLVLSGKFVHVYKESNNTAFFPCHVSNPDVRPQLFKEERNGNFSDISSKPWVSYDPKMGFGLYLKTVKDWYGRYKCVTDIEDDEVEIFLERGMKPQHQFQEIISREAGLFYDPERTEIACCSPGGQPAPKLHTIMCMNPSICKMKEHKLYKVKNNGDRTMKRNCTSDKIYMRDYGILRCKGEGIDIFRTVFTDFAPMSNELMGLYYNFNEILPEKMMYLSIHTRAPYYHRQVISVTCEGMNSYFSDGHQWTMKWRNGTVTNFYPTEFTDDPKYHGVRVVEIILNWKMMELSCHIPVWNSTQWVSKSAKLDVQKSYLPTIIGSFVEELSLVVNDTDKLIECKSSGKPTPAIRWLKNGDEIPKKMVVLNENGTSVLLFTRITHDTQGEYKCLSQNIMGETTKIFRVLVTVNTSGSSAWGTTAAVLVPLLVIGFILTAGGLIWKMQIQKKIVNHLSRVVFRDTQNTYPTTT